MAELPDFPRVRYVLELAWEDGENSEEVWTIAVDAAAQKRRGNGPVALDLRAARALHAATREPERLIRSDIGTAGRLEVVRRARALQVHDAVTMDHALRFHRAATHRTRTLS
jgi:hypothetical protein